MNILVMGAGEVGKGLARRLTMQGHQVRLIDDDSGVLGELETQLDVMVVEGNGASASILLEAGIEDSELFVGVSDNDEANMIACALAKQFGVQTTIARVRSEEYIIPNREHYAQAMNIDLIINPDEVASQQLYDLLQNPVASKVADFAGGRLKLIGLRVGKDAPICYHTLSELPELGFSGALLVATLVRQDEVEIPRGDTRVLPGDRIYVICALSELDKVNEMGGVKDRHLDRVVLVGASRVSYFLAERLREAEARCILIEQDAQRCEQFATELEATTVLNGDGTDIKILNEAGVDTTDGFVSCSQDDETNILSALLAKEEGAKRVITLIRKPQYIPLLSHIKPIDVAVNPRLVTINDIMRYVRQRKNLSMATMAGEKAEAIEVEVSPESPLVGRKLKEGVMPREVLLGAIVRGDEVIIPSGDDELQAGDRAVVIALKESISKVDDLLSRNGEGTGLQKFFKSITKAVTP